MLRETHLRGNVDVASPRLASVVVVVIAAACTPNGCTPPQPGLDPNSSVIETGTSGGPNLVLVTLDNPDIHFLQGLVGVPTQCGDTASPQEIISSGSSFEFEHSDFRVDVNGEAPPNSSGDTLFHGSVTEDLYPWTNEDGNFGAFPGSTSAVAPFDTHGVRLGYKATPIEFVETWPDGVAHPDYASSFSVALDPNVLLVPIQVVIPYSSTLPQNGVRKGFHRLLWDGAITLSQNTVVNDTYPTCTELGSVHRTWDTNAANHDGWINRGTDGFIDVGPWHSPDSVWSACDVQFRMVSYVEFETTDDTLINPPQSVCDATGDAEAPVGRAIQAALGHFGGTLPTADYVPRVVVLQHCNCPQASFEGSGGGAYYNIPLNTICIPANGTNNRFVLSHELGHALGLCDAYSNSSISSLDTCAGFNPKVPCTEQGYSLMCENPSAPPSSYECSQARASASAQFGTSWAH